MTDPVHDLLAASLAEEADVGGMIRVDAAAAAAAEAITRLPAAPWLAVLRIRHALDVHDHEAALALSEALQAQAGASALIVLGDDAELDALADDDLHRLGLIRIDLAVQRVEDHFDVCSQRSMTPTCLEPVLRDTPGSGDAEIPG